MTVTLGYRDPNTGRDFIVELGSYDEEQRGYWAVEYIPETGSSVGGIFFAHDVDLKEYGKPNARNAWIAAAESAREAHHLTASSEDNRVASGRNYDRSQAAFKAAIHAAYPELDYRAVYGVWIDCMESVAYCARQVATMDRDEARRFIAMGGE